MQTYKLGLVLKNINRICLQILYSIYMYKEDLAFNDLQSLICHKTQPANQCEIVLLIDQQKMNKSKLCEY